MKKMSLDSGPARRRSHDLPTFVSLMIRHTLLICALWLSIAQAQGQAQDQSQPQDQPIAVYFEPLKGSEFARLNQAIQAALSQSPLQLETKPGPHTLIVSLPDKVEVEKKQVSGIYYSFTVSFSRDGNALGKSEQSCNAAKLSDCTDQMVLDVKSVATPR